MQHITVLADEPLVRDLFHRLASRDGFIVQEADGCLNPDSKETCNLQCCTDDDAPVLVAIEVILKRLCSGLEAAQKALSRWPGVKILLTSASPTADWPRDAVTLLQALPRDSYLFLPKPFTAAQFDAAVDGLLSRSRTI